MTIFNSDIGNSPARTPRFGGVIARVATFTVPTGMSTSDQGKLFTIPAGASLIDMWAVNNGADSFDVGTEADDDAFIATVAADGAIDRIPGSAITTTFATETDVLLVFNTEPVAADVVTVGVSYVLTP